MLSDYPELVSKLNVLLCAGLTIHKAFIRILHDYDTSTTNDHSHFFYKELRICLSQIDNGTSESFAYTELGRRLGLNCYIRLVTLLEQNIKKGTRELRFLLLSEVDAAYEEKKHLVLKLGEEASTKLLLPMMLLFFVILILVMFPAFFGISF